MYTLVYLSSASVLFSEEQLQAILAVSRRNNERLDITGILLYHEGAILQALEGEERPVMECYQRILLDDRHRGVIRIIDGHSDERCFPDWSMGFRQLNAEQWEAVSGYRPIGSGALQFKEMSGPGVAQDMVTFIRSFCRTNFKS